MKSLLLTLFALPMAAQAAPEVRVGVAGGVVVMDPLEVLDTTWTVVPRLGYGFNETIGLELDLGFAAGKTRIGDHPYTALTPRLNFVGKIWTKGVKDKDGNIGKPPPIQPILVAGLGGIYKNTNDGNALGPDYLRKDLDFMINAGPGLLIPIGPAHLRTDLRWLLNFGSESFRGRGDQFIDWEWTAGVGFTFGGEKDADKDGIIDSDDQCVNDPEDIDTFEDEDGCPDLDNDEDGIADIDDKAPNDAEDMDDFEDEDGAPDPDNDEDGVLDGDDLCPIEAGSVEAKGCPDADGDGIIDAKDECPDEKGPESSFGCPDSDEDRVPDYRDLCPDEKGPAQADPKRSDGCPHTVFVTAKAIRILDKVFFDTGKATIKPVSYPLLDEIAETLKKYEGIKKVSIEGHTDNTGDKAFNMTLSDDRAKSVMTYLIENDGIDAARLDAKGFGPDKPLEGVDPDSQDGRAQNRRVEFNITEQETRTVELRRPVLDAIEAATDDLDMGDLVVKVSRNAPPDFVTGDSVCKAKLTIDDKGMVEFVEVNNPKCNGMARSTTRRLMRMWEFEPVMVDDKATAVTTVFTVTFAPGKAATFKHEADKLAPKQEAPPE